MFIRADMILLSAAALITLLAPIIGAAEAPVRRIIVLNKAPGKDFIPNRLARFATLSQNLHVLDGIFTDADMAYLKANNIIDHEEDDRTLTIAPPMPGSNVHGASSAPTSRGDQSTASWGLARISNHARITTGDYYYPTSAGSNVDIYILDTGIDVSNPDFEGRARFGINTVTTPDSNPSDTTDENGHGTFVAGIIGSKTYGVAKNATMIAVKTFGKTGAGSLADFLTGIAFVLGEYRKNGKRPSVMNLSLSTPKSQAVNQAVEEAVRAGITVVVAAGNGDASGKAQDACSYSPSSSSSVITVGATDRTDAPGPFSNYGSCVSILAPGVNVSSILAPAVRSGSDFVKDVNSDGSASGTSFASPYVSGIAALILSEDGTLSPSLVFDRVVSTATTGQLHGLIGSTPNALAFNGASATAASSDAQDHAPNSFAALAIVSAITMVWV